MADRIPPKNANEAEYYAALDAYTAAVARLRVAKQCAPSLVRAIQTQRQKASADRRKAAEATERQTKPRYWLDECSSGLRGTIYYNLWHSTNYKMHWEDITAQWVRAKGREYWAQQDQFGPKRMAELDALIGQWDQT